METKDIMLPQLQETSVEELEESALKLLNPKQQRFVHLYLAGSYKLPEIAELLNVSMSTIRSWLRNPTIKGHIEQVQIEEDDIVKQGIKMLRLKAVYKMNELMDSKIDGIAYQAARDVLDRTGHKAPTKQEVTVEVKTFEQQLTELMKEQNMESEFIEGYAEVIDSGEENS